MAATAAGSAGGKLGGDDDPARRLVISAKKPRRSGRKLSYTLEDKEKIILMMEQGWKNCDIQRAIGVPESTLRTIKKKKEDLKKSIAVAKRYYSDNTSALKALTNEITDRRRLIAVTEHLVLNWAKNRLKEQGTVNGSNLRAQASIFYKNLCRNAAIKNPPPFYASEGWLAKFKKRCGIEVSKGQSNGDSMDTQEDHPIALLTIRRTSRTSYYDIKEEPATPTSDDPLAILPEEESRLRSVSGSEVMPRVIIPAVRQSLIGSLSTNDAEAHIGIIDPELDLSTSDSEATLSISVLDASDVEYEYDFMGFEDIIKVGAEQDSEDMSTEAPPPPPPPLHHEAIIPPPQPEGLIPDLSSRTPNSEPTLPENSSPEQQHRTSTPWHAQPNEVRQTANSVPTLNEDSQSDSQHRASMPWHTGPREARPNEARPGEATQTDTQDGQPSFVTIVEREQAVGPQLQGKQKGEADVHAKLAAVRLENERIRQDILKEVLMQNKIETAVKRQKALWSGIDIGHL